MSAEDLSPTKRLCQKLIERGGAGFAGDQVERARGLARGAEFDKRRVPRLDEQPLRFAIVKHLEMGRDVRLERKEPQQPLGEGVQRLNPEAAGGLDRAREQLPREDQLRRIRRVCSAVDDRLRQGLVGEARPLCESAENAVGHVGGGGLGVGEAKNLRRRRPIEQAAAARAG